MEEEYKLAKNVTDRHKKFQLLERHAARFLQILLGYKICFGYITMAATQYGCHCGAHPKECSESMDCLDDCCRSGWEFQLDMINGGAL